jgi:hypothetical protein
VQTFTGGSLRDGAVLLKAEYNIHLVGAVYLVDRSIDRKSLPKEKLGAADPKVWCALSAIALLTTALGLFIGQSH